MYYIGKQTNSKPYCWLRHSSHSYIPYHYHSVALSETFEAMKTCQFIMNWVSLNTILLVKLAQNFRQNLNPFKTRVHFLYEYQHACFMLAKCKIILLIIKVLPKQHNHILKQESDTSYISAACRGFLTCQKDLIVISTSISIHRHYLVLKKNTNWT